MKGNALMPVVSSNMREILRLLGGLKFPLFMAILLISMLSNATATDGNPSPDEGRENIPLSRPIPGLRSSTVFPVPESRGFRIREIPDLPLSGHAQGFSVSAQARNEQLSPRERFPFFLGVGMAIPFNNSISVDTVPFIPCSGLGTPHSHDRTGITSSRLGDLESSKEEPLSEEQDKILRLTQPLMKPFMDGRDRGRIVQAIGAIPADDRESVVTHAQRLMTQNMNGGDLVTIIKALRKIPADNRESFVTQAQLLITQDMGELDRAKIIKALRKTSADDRESVVTHAQRLMTQNMGGYDCAKIIKALGKIPADDRESVVTQVQRLMAPAMDGDDCAKIIKALGKIPADDRESVVTHAQRLMTQDMWGYDCAKIIYVRATFIQAIGAIPASERENSIENLRLIMVPDGSINSILELLNILSSMEQQERNIVCAQINKYYGRISSARLLQTLRFIPPEAFATFSSKFKSQEKPNTYKYLSAFARQNPVPFGYLCNLISENVDFKDAVFNYWYSLFLQPNEERSGTLSKLILDNLERLEIYEAHPLAQEALRTRILLENTQESGNPYHFHRTTLEKRNRAVEWDSVKPPVETFEGVQIALNPSYFRNMDQQKVTFAELPVINRHLLRELDTRISTRLESNPILAAEIEQSFAAAYSALRQGSLGSPLLQSLLDTNGAPEDLVPPVAAKMIAIVNFLQTLENKAPEGKMLSLQEETFLSILASIQKCPTGKEEGIHAYYANLPLVFKYARLANDNFSTENGIQWVNAVLRKEVENLFSGANAYFKHLIEMRPQEEVQEAAHQGRYVKNVIGPDVGLAEPAAFDRHSQMLYQKLIDRSKQALLHEFYRHLLPHQVVNSILNAANAELQQGGPIYNWLLPFIPEEHRSEAWDINMQSEKVGLTEKGAIFLLNGLGVLKMH